MFSSILINLLRFLVLSFIQVMVLDNMELHNMFNPYLYPLFILLLPISTPAWLVMLLGFGAGYAIDVFSHTAAMHAAALTCMAFLRQPLLKILRPSPGYQPEDRPTIGGMGFMWFITYSSLLFFAHHLFLFIIESFSFTQFLFVISKIAISSLVSISLAVMLQYLFYRRKRVSA